jgi:hypothetical protein
MAVKANLGIPLGIAVAPTERGEISRMFVDSVIEHGFSHDRLPALPLLSDEGAALKGYAAGYHRFHFYCFRHLLEALGSGTLAAMLAQRLLFTCSNGLIAVAGQTKFRALFGLGTGSTVNLSVFMGQALWGDRGAGFGVSTCTNLVEGLHGRLNDATRDLVSLHTKCAQIVDILGNSAGNWAKRVEKLDTRL